MSGQHSKKHRSTDKQRSISWGGIALVIGVIVLGAGANAAVVFFGARAMGWSL